MQLLDVGCLWCGVILLMAAILEWRNTISLRYMNIIIYSLYTSQHAVSWCIKTNLINLFNVRKLMQNNTIFNIFVVSGVNQLN